MIYSTFKGIGSDKNSNKTEDLTLKEAPKT